MCRVESILPVWHSNSQNVFSPQEEQVVWWDHILQGAGGEQSFHNYWHYWNELLLWWSHGSKVSTSDIWLLGHHHFQSLTLLETDLKIRWPCCKSRVYICTYNVVCTMFLFIVISINVMCYKQICYLVFRFFLCMQVLEMKAWISIQ